eukprot:2270536-Amphidinium_carterae.1
MLREQLLPSISQARTTLECKLNRTWQADLTSRVLNLLVNNAVRAVRLVAQSCGPAQSAALARLLISYPRHAE